VVTPRSILASPLLRWRSQADLHLVPDTAVHQIPQKQVPFIPWAFPVVATVQVREEVGDQLAWYKETDWKEVTDYGDMDDESLSECVDQLFTSFMWHRLQAKLSKQVMVRLCQDKVEPTAADLIMNIAIQLDPLTPWQRENTAQDIVINGYDKHVWYTGDQDMITRISKLTPDQLYQAARTALTSQFKHNLLLSINERYHQTYQEKILNKTCEEKCNEDKFYMGYNCPFYGMLNIDVWLMMFLVTAVIHHMNYHTCTCLEITQKMFQNQNL
jgi:hypothetical protein